MKILAIIIILFCSVFGQTYWWDYPYDIYHLKDVEVVYSFKSTATRYQLFPVHYYLDCEALQKEGKRSGIYKFLYKDFPYKKKIMVCERCYMRRTDEKIPIPGLQVIKKGKEQ